jgi:hypothetical protein
MQVRRLPRQIIRNGCAASRLLAAKTSNIEAERRRDAVARWRRAYASYELPRQIDKLKPLVDAFAHRYNHHRPRQALGDLTPAEYLIPRVTAIDRRGLDSGAKRNEVKRSGF